MSRRSRLMIEGIQFIYPKGVPVQGWNKPVHEGLHSQEKSESFKRIEMMQLLLNAYF